MANKDVEVSRDNKSVANIMDVMPDMDRMFNSMVENFFGPRFNSLLGDWPEMSRRSMSKIHESDKAYVLVAEIPGVPQEDIKISVNGNLLTVRAEHQEESGSDKMNHSFRRQYRSFHQSFSLPSTVDSDNIEAHYEDGILEVMLPKTEQAQPKKIEVQSGKGSLMNKTMVNENQQNTIQKNSGTKH